MKEYLGNNNLQMLGLFNLTIVFIIWSSTFLAIRVAVSGENALTPFFMGYGRMALSGILLLMIGWIRNKRMWLNAEEVKLVLFSSLFIWGGGTALLTWGMQYEPSGLAALVTASIPVFVAIIATINTKKSPSGLLIISLTLGCAGLIIVAKASLEAVVGNGIWPLVSLVLSAFFCAMGFFLQSKYTTNLSPVVLAGYQLTISSFIFLGLMLFLHEPLHYPSVKSLIAWVYLTFATAIGVIAFGNILRLLPMNIAMTYAYVNPVLALIWGWCFLNETISFTTFFGAILVIMGVMGIFKDKK